MKVNDAKVTVRFFGSVRDVFQEKETEIAVKEARTVKDLLIVLCNTYERRMKLLDANGKIKSDISMFKNGRNIHFLKGMDTSLEGGDNIAIFPPVYGG